MIARSALYSLLTFIAALGFMLMAANTAVSAQESIIEPTEAAAEEEPEADVSAMEDMGIVKLQSLDKVTARSMTFEVKVGNTVKFGQIFIKVQACRKSSPIEKPESASFLQIWEVSKDNGPSWIFSGWMFASSPGLSAMDHPIYDVWVIDCLPGETTDVSDDAIETEDLSEESAKDKPKEPIEPKQKLESVVKDTKSDEKPDNQ